MSRSDLMNTAEIQPPGTSGTVERRSVAHIVQWLNELEECRAGGLISDEDYAMERAEKLSELLCQHRALWMAPIVAAGSVGILVGCAFWVGYGDLQITLTAGALGALFGLIMLAQIFRENMKTWQIRERLEILNALLAHDLLSADEFLMYEERLYCGEAQLRVLGNM
jgi:hypothetical protein